jgi:hypothetical protein
VIGVSIDTSADWAEMPERMCEVWLLKKQREPRLVGVSWTGS